MINFENYYICQYEYNDIKLSSHDILYEHWQQILLTLHNCTYIHPLISYQEFNRDEDDVIDQMTQLKS